MTAAPSTVRPAGPSGPALPAAEGVARVHATLDDVGSAEVVGPVTGRDIAEVDRAIARMQALKLRMVSSADRSQVASASGMSGTAAWLAVHTRSGAAEAAGAVGLATALEESLPATREALAAGALSTAHASVIAGTVERLPETVTNEERARVESSLVHQARRLDPPKLRRAARRALEAAERSAEEVARHEDAELRDEEARAEARVRLTMHDNRDGTVSGHFTVPTVAGAMLRRLVQEIASPRRTRSSASGGAADAGTTSTGAGVGGTEGAPAGSGPLVDSAEDTTVSTGARGSGAASDYPSVAPTVTGMGARGTESAPTVAGADGASLQGGLTAIDAGESGRGRTQSAPPVTGVGADSSESVLSAGDAGERSPGPGAATSASRRPEGFDWAHRHGMAFVELLEHLPDDRLHGKVAATVVVTVGLEAWRAGLGAASLDTGQQISAAQARRLACNAGVLPAILGGASLPLDLGRTARFFSETQNVALATVYDECAAVGCDRPYSWCDLHHEDPWAQGGRTDLHLAVPLCGWHHRRVHDAKYRFAIDEVDGRKVVTFSR